MQANNKIKSWVKGLTLLERISILDKPIIHDRQKNEILSGMRFNKWSEQYPFCDLELFSNRLEIDGIDLEEFKVILSADDDKYKNLIDKSSEYYIDTNSIESTYEHYYNNRNAITDDSEFSNGFLNLVAPLIYSASNYLETKIIELSNLYSELPFDSSLIMGSLKKDLYSSIFEIISPTMVLELNIARLRGDLFGVTSKERYSSFIRHISKAETAINYLNEYQVMTRLINSCLKNWIDNSFKLLENLCLDWWKICDVLGVEPTSVLTKIESTSSDKHRDGQCVMRLSFDSEEKLIYKPRNLDIELHFQSILKWINRKKEVLAFPTLLILSEKHHGWVQYVEHRSCTDEEEVHRFYLRQGAYLALLYALEATDFHFENVIAAGESPFLVDLEALFHPRLYNNESPETVSEKSFEVMANSVLRVGLLPRRTKESVSSSGLDLSGMGAAPGQIADGVTYWCEGGTDNMHQSFKTIRVPGGNNRPLLAGKEVNILDYSDDILEGFRALYNLLLKEQNEFLSATGPIQELLNDEIRVVIRPTHSYGIIRRRGFHPGALGNGLDRDRLLDLLWAAVPKSPQLISVIPFEQRDLNKSDIPIFNSKVNSCDLFSSQGDLIQNFFEESGIESVKKRLQSFNHQDIELQTWFIKSSLATLIESDHTNQRCKYEPDNVPPSVSNEQLLDYAIKIGDRLIKLVHLKNNKALWFGISHLNRDDWTIRPSGLDLYNGATGIALFLAYLGKITNISKYKVLAQNGVNTILGELEQNSLDTLPIGAFSGWGGLAYSLTHFSTLWDCPDYMLRSKEIILNRIATNIENDEIFDIIGGVSGGVLSILSCYKATQSKEILEVAVKCGQWLVKKAQKQNIGIAWQNGIESSAPLTGFGHGATGIAYALSELAHVSGERYFSLYAQQAIDYEDSLFSLSAGNWPDLRNTRHVADQRKYMTAWCHGASGMVLARMYMQKYREGQIPNNIQSAIDEAALNAILRQGQGQSHCLCHGDLGNIEALSLAASCYGSPWKEHQEKYKSNIIAGLSSRKWLCGVPLDIETPGLMTGLAGIGYGLLRLAYPDQVPSILLLRPSVI